MSGLPAFRRLAASLVVALVVLRAGLALAQPAATPPPATDRLTVQYGVEYWIRASHTRDFDFDGAKNDALTFGWHRIKPFLSVQKGGVELTLQGQDSRSHHVPELNPNGTSTYTWRTNQLDFVKAFVRVTPKPGVTLKVGREQADGIDVGISRKLASSSNYATVLRSFDLVSVRVENSRDSLTTVTSA